MALDPLAELVRLIDKAGLRLYVHMPLCGMWTDKRECTQSCGKLTMEAKIELIDGKMPTRATEGSAGWDLYAAEDVTISAGAIAPVRVGFKIALPNDMEMQIRSRSGLAMKGIAVANSPGTVDSDFRGEVKVLLHNSRAPDPFDASDFKVKKGDRIAQAVFSWVPQISVVQVDAVDSTARGEGGFGSTGK